MSRALFPYNCWDSEPRGSFEGSASKNVQAQVEATHVHKRGQILQLHSPSENKQREKGKDIPLGSYNIFNSTRGKRACIPSQTGQLLEPAELPSGSIWEKKKICHFRFGFKGTKDRPQGKL